MCSDGDLAGQGTMASGAVMDSSVVSRIHCLCFSGHHERCGNKYAVFAWIVSKTWQTFIEHLLFTCLTCFLMGSPPQPSELNALPHPKGSRHRELRDFLAEAT